MLCAAATVSQCRTIRTGAGSVIPVRRADPPSHSRTPGRSRARDTGTRPATPASNRWSSSGPVDASPVAAEYVVPEGPLRQPRNIVWIYGESLEITGIGVEPDVVQRTGVQFARH